MGGLTRLLAINSQGGGGENRILLTDFKTNPEKLLLL